MNDNSKQAPAGIKPTRTLDAKGLICPMPLLRIKKEMDRLNSGDILEVLGTDEGSRGDIPGWAARAGHEFLGERVETNFFRFFMKKK